MERLGALFVTCCASAAAQSYSWTHFAGMPPPFGSVDATGSDARFFRPRAVAAVDGRVYVTDTLNHTIRVISPTGAVTTLAGAAGQPGSTDGTGIGARFFVPSGITSAGGILYVTDRLNHLVRRVSITGNVTTYAGRAGVSGSADGARTQALFNDPTDIRGDATGNLYVADRLNHTIRKIAADGTVSTVAGLAGSAGRADGTRSSARFDEPDGIALDSNGTVYVADTNNHTIRRIALDGTVTTMAGSAGLPGTADGIGSAARFRFPTRVMVNSGGGLIVSDAGNECLRSVTLQGEVTLFAGQIGVEGSRDGPRTSARFFGPTGVTLLPDGLVVADSLNHSVRKIGLNDEVTTLAGPGGNFGRIDGTALVARFNYPNGIAAHVSGDLYVADTRGNAIRRIAPDGTVTTVAGKASSDAYIDGPAGMASLNAPHGLAVAPDRTVYFCEQQRHTIRVLHPDGSVSTLAGTQGNMGSSDGEGAVARFDFPSAIVRDTAGNLYIADTGNHTIRRIAAGTSTVTTFAGLAGNTGSGDGNGPAARFSAPRGIGLDTNGNVYVADTGNHAIRKITPAAAVTTVAGRPGTFGSVDGTGSAARFWSPTGITIDAGGWIFVADTYNDTIRRIVGGTVSTIGGRVGVPHYAEGTGGAAFFFSPNGIAIDRAGAIYVVQHGNNLVMRGALDVMPAIMVPPQPVAVQAGATATFSVAAIGGGLAYQWRFNGAPIPGATDATWNIARVQPASAGSYSVEITNSAGKTTSVAVELVVSPAMDFARIINLSILTPIETAGETFTMGYVVGGSGTAGAIPLVIRAAGPALGAFGIDDRLGDPKLELFAGQSPSGANDNWGGPADLAGAMSAVGAFPFASATSLDAAARASVTMTAGQPSDNSVKVSANGSGTGRVLAEVYDATPEASLTPTTPRLINVSVLKEFGPGFTAGFVIRGTGTKTVLIRAIGPGLAAFGITSGYVSDPQVRLFRGTTELRGNNDWQADAATTFTQVGAFALSAGSKDAALVATLEPDDYTVQVSGVGGTTGVGLVEVYEVP